MSPEQKAQLEEDLKRDRVIKQQYEKDVLDDQRTFKLLLLGAGESGKVRSLASFHQTILYFIFFINNLKSTCHYSI
jgi:hypothetical protein